MFSAAFVLILIDMVTPAIVKPWDLRETFALMDKLMSRGVKIAGPYKKDLVEIDTLRGLLRQAPVLDSVSGADELHQPVEAPHSTSTMASREALFQSQLEQDRQWSAEAVHNGWFGALNMEVIESAIYGLPSEDDQLLVNIDGSDWMW